MPDINDLLGNIQSVGIIIGLLIFLGGGLILIFLGDYYMKTRSFAKPFLDAWKSRGALKLVQIWDGQGNVHFTTGESKPNGVNTKPIGNRDFGSFETFESSISSHRGVPIIPVHADMEAVIDSKFASWVTQNENNNLLPARNDILEMGNTFPMHFYECQDEKKIKICPECNSNETQTKFINFLCLNPECNNPKALEHYCQKCKGKEIKEIKKDVSSCIKCGFTSTDFPESIIKTCGHIWDVEEKNIHPNDHTFMEGIKHKLLNFGKKDYEVDIPNCPICGSINVDIFTKESPYEWQLKNPSMFSIDSARNYMNKVLSPLLSELRVEDAYQLGKKEGGDNFGEAITLLTKSLPFIVGIAVVYLILSGGDDCQQMIDSITASANALSSANAPPPTPTAIITG